MRKVSIKIQIVCLLLVVFTSNRELAAAETAAEPSRKLKIGVLGPKTVEGSAEFGKYVFEGVAMAARDFNSAGGIKGKKVETSFVDNKGVMLETMQGAARLIDDKVVAIIASPDGLSSFTPVSMANESGTIFMSAGSRRHIEKSGPYIFRNALPEEIATDETIKYCIEKLQYKRYAIITSMRDEESTMNAVSLYMRAIQKYKGEVVSQAYVHFDLSTKEAIAKLKKESGTNIDAVIFTGNSKGAIEVLKELRRQGIKAPFVGSENLNAAEFLKAGGKAAIGSVFYTSFTTLSDDPVTVKFVEAYRNAKGKDPSPLVAASYDSFMLIAEAIKKAGTTEPSKVKNALTEIKGFRGVSGVISMSEDAQTIRTPFIILVEKGETSPELRLVK